MEVVKLRNLFSEFPEMPEDILVQAQGDGPLLNGIRAKDQYVVVHEVDHEYSAHPVPKGGPSLEKRILHCLDESPDAKLFYNGKPVRYKVVQTLVLKPEEEAGGTEPSTQEVEGLFKCERVQSQDKAVQILVTYKDGQEDCPDIRKALEAYFLS